jgi:3-methyladenine DNA glycosylase AlkD
MVSSPLAVEITNAFAQSANAEYAPKMSAYMKHKFPFFGIQTPERRDIVRSCLKLHPITERKQLLSAVQSLYQGANRESHYSALDILWTKRKLLIASDVQLLEELITTHSWWDSIDSIAKSVGEHYKRFQLSDKPKIEEWILSDNLWLNRTAIIFQLSFSDKTDTEILLKAILAHAESNEFFHQKAIGWALRQYSYTNPQFVLDFIDSHKLKPLSVREATKALLRRNR